MQTLPDSLRGEYERLASDRSPFLERARDAAKYTLPSLVPPSGSTSGGRLRKSYSNFGARCVNSLASKLLMALFPARQTFFRYVLEDSVLAKIGRPDLRAEVEKGLAKVEQAVQQDLETTPTRAPAGESIKHLIVAGNVLVYDKPDGGLKVFPLSQYVVQRDGEGTLMGHVTEEALAPAALPESVRAQVIQKIKDERRTSEKTVRVYTGVFATDSGWKVWQEVEGFPIPESRGTYPADSSPWMVLRWSAVDGENYGRGMVEDFLGYFTSIEALTGAVVKGTAVMAKVVFLRRPNSSTKASAVARAETGDVVDGVPEDVLPLRVDKQLEFAEARQLISDLKNELAFAFALNDSARRNAERVTAEEIRFMAQELDSMLGGTYSTFGIEFQLPLLKSRMRRLEKSGKLPALPKKSLRPMIITGLDALGRGAELDNLRAFVKDVVELGGPEALDTYLNFDDLLKRLATARGLNTEGLAKTPEEVAEAAQQKQMAAMVEQLGPNAITQMGQLAKQDSAQGTPA